MAKRLSEDDIRLAVAFGLLNIDRIDLLDDSQLSSLLSVRPSGILGRGKAIRTILQEAAGNVSTVLCDVPGMSDKKALLDEVLTGKTIAQWAREHGRSREAVSRRVWHDVTCWVAKEVQRLA